MVVIVVGVVVVGGVVVVVVVVGGVIVVAAVFAVVCTKTRHMYSKNLQFGPLGAPKSGRAFLGHFFACIFLRALSSQLPGGGGT